MKDEVKQKTKGLSSSVIQHPSSCFRVYQNGKEVSGKLSLDLMRTEAAGIFESMRAYGGRIFHEEEHLTRLLESAKTVGYGPNSPLKNSKVNWTSPGNLRSKKNSPNAIQFPPRGNWGNPDYHHGKENESQDRCQGRPFPEPAKLRLELKAALKAFGEKECYVRLTLWEGRSLAILGSREHPKEIYKTGVALKTASFPRGGPNTFPWQAKASAYQQAILASTEPHPDKIYEWVFLDQGGILTETRIGNFFIVKHPAKGPVLKDLKTGSWTGRSATLLTPPEHLILNGVTRRFVIKCALELGIGVREIPLTRHEFFNADEAFLCNTSWEILPVRELDGRVIGAGKPGPVTMKLHRYFKRRVHQDVAPRRSPSTY